MPEQTPEPRDLVADGHMALRLAKAGAFNVYGWAGEHLPAFLAELETARARIAELEAAQREPVGYVVGHQYDDATLLEFEPTHVDPFGDRARAYGSRGEAEAFAAKCGPHDRRTEFEVYELRKVVGDE
ncbi:MULTISPECIES: hypothetical protein [Nocardia]|uniref:Uncharacterized protein n=1 Tax=Nocardia nova TaxID=37330 RepID=A0A2T2Z884_9NOCA|nr:MULTISPECIES: hypothetical protein [Nocardia]PSR63970.1 hypothetical protein C8259_08955 [Nocardia nova]